MKILGELPTFTEVFNTFRSKKRNLGKDALNIYSFQSFSMLIGIISSVLIARTLGPSGKGIIDLFSLLTLLISTFGMFGINSGLLFYLANRNKSLAEVHGSAILYTLILGPLFLTFGIIFMHFLSNIFQGLPVKLILIAFLLSPFLFYKNLWINLMIGINSTPKIYKIQFIYTTLNVLAIIFLWLNKILTTINVIYLLVSLSLISCIINFLILGQKNNFKIKLSQTLLKDSIKYGLKIYPGFIANWIHFRVDQLMINWFVGVSGVGLYALSVKWAEILLFIGFGISNAGIYKISSEEPKKSYLLTKKLFKLVFILACIGGILLALLSKFLFEILYGQQFNNSIIPLIVLIPGIIFWGSGSILSQFLAFNRGKPHLCTIAAFIGMIVNIIGNLLVIPKWGIVGAAATSTISYIIVFIIILYFFWRFGNL